MSHSFIIIDDNQEDVTKTQAIAERFRNMTFLASANTYDDGVNLILEHQPQLIFLEIDPSDNKSNLSLNLINELYRFLKVLPKIIITTNNSESAIEAIQHGAFDYLSKPIDGNALRKTILKFEKTNESLNAFSANPKIATQQQFIQAIAEVSTPDIVDNKIIEDISVKHEIVESEDTVETLSEVESEDKAILIDSEETEIPIKKVFSNIETNKEDKPLIICVKSYGDYRFIEAKDICYLQADNNSTDIHLYNGEMITAFKTLKHFENVLSSPFVRIHNSYIVNIDYVSRIHTGNSVCYIKNTTTKLPFSKSYKENVDAIINSITKGNYLEI